MTEDDDAQQISTSQCRDHFTNIKGKQYMKKQNSFNKVAVSHNTNV